MKTDPLGFRQSMRAKGFVLGPNGWVKSSSDTKLQVTQKSLSEGRIEPPIRPIEAPLNEKGVISLILPYPPSVNRFVSFNRKTGLRFKSQSAREYTTKIQSIVAGLNLKPLEGDVIFTMFLYRPRKSGDVTNYEKVLQDALEGILYLNDRQICESHCYRRDDKTNPRVEVFCKPYLL